MERNYELYVNGHRRALQQMRVSIMPFNRHWPGHQRTLDQTEVTAFASFEFVAKTEITVDCDFDFERVCIRPLSLGIHPTVKGRRISFTIERPCQAVLEIDGTRSALHLFADPVRQKPVLSPDDLYFGPGEHHVGRIVLKSNQTVHLDEGAVVYGEIYGEGVENVAILGRGILDHSQCEPSETDPLIIDPPRPSPIEIRYAKGLVIKDVIVRDPCFLTVRPICCEDLLIDNIKIIGCWRYNSDGIDLINCRNGVISNCFVRTFDDSLCLKGFHFPLQGEMFYRGKTYDTMENVTFENCVVWNEWGHALHVGVDLCAKEIKNCRFLNCDVIHTEGSALNISSCDYAEVSDIVYENIRVELDEKTLPPQLQKSDDDVYSPSEDVPYMPHLFVLHVTKNEYSCGGTKRSKISGVSFRNIQVYAPSMPPSFLAGYDEEHAVRDISFQSVTRNGTPLQSAEALRLTVKDFVDGLTIEP